MSYVVVGFAGALTSVAMTMAALRFYVSIPSPYPYLIWIAAFCLLQIVLLLVRKAHRKKAGRLAGGFAFVLEAVLFAAGAAAALYGLLAIYPPNMT